MTATIHSLHPEQGEQLGPGTSAGRLLNALEQMASTVIGEQLRAMFGSADDLLFEMADKTRNSKEKQIFLETMRIVRLQQPKILNAFQESLHRAFARADLDSFDSHVDLNDLESWSMQDSSELEEKIAVTNLDAKAQALFSSQIYELEQRMSQFSAQSSGAVSSTALSPVRIVEAFQRSMKGLDIEFPIKLVIYKLFDRIVISNLGNVFTGANHLLAEHGFEPRRKQPKDKPPPPPQGGFAGHPGGVAGGSATPHAAGASFGGAPGGIPAPASFQGMASGLHGEFLAQAMQPYLHGRTPAGNPALPMQSGAWAQMAPAQESVSHLQSQTHGSPGGAGGDYDNAQLASEMLTVMDAVGRGHPINSWMPAQNLALVSRMFNDFYTDPRLSEAARPMLSRLQFPTMKVALSDASFFSNSQHPVRSLVNDVFDTATGVRSSSGADFQQLELLVRDLLQRFDPDPAHLRQAARETRPVTEDEAEQFLYQQQQRAHEQRRNIKEKIRRIVAQELRLQIGARQLPKPMMSLLLSGFAPLLATYYLRGGSESQDWRDTLELLDRMLRTFDPDVQAASDRVEKEAAVIAGVSQRLLSAGLPEEKLRGLITGLVGSYLILALSPHSSAVPAPVLAVPATAAPAVASPSVAPAPHTTAPGPVVTPAIQERGLLLLRPGEWFKVWLTEAQHCRWLKLTSVHPGPDYVIFEDFGSENFLKLRMSAFVQDLAAGRSCVVNPDPAVQKLVQLLPPPDAEAPEAGAVWYKNNPPADVHQL